MCGILIQIWNTTLVFMQPWYKSINAQDLLNAKVNKRKNNYLQIQNVVLVLQNMCHHIQLQGKELHL